MSDKHCFLLRYKDVNDRFCNSVITICEEDYLENADYKMNLQNIVKEMYNYGGLWLNENTIIPFHRVLSVECCDSKKEVVKPKDPVPQATPNNPNSGNKNRRYFRHRSKNKYVQPQNKTGDNGQPKPEQSGSSDPKSTI